jgi:hypothetical protein
LGLHSPFIVTNMSAGPEEVVHFYNGRGPAEQWTKVGKYALSWTRLSWQRFVVNQVRLALFILAYNLGSFLRGLCLPNAVKHWSLRSLRVKLIKIVGRLVHQARRLVFQLAEVAVPRELFAGILGCISRLKLAPSLGPQRPAWIQWCRSRQARTQEFRSRVA